MGAGSKQGPEAGLLVGSELKAQELPEGHGVWLEVFSREQDHM